MKCLDQPLVLVDIETTGLSPVGSRIIEIACIRYEQGRETARFVSLVDPEQSLPKTIQSITGIMPAHLKGAPTFIQIADEVEAISQDAVFVAHNVRFDYSFIKAEMERAGRKFSKKLLCTVKLSRALFPEHPKHDLTSLINRFGFACTSRHRALDDTEVLLQFLKHVEKEFSRETLTGILQTLFKKTSLPAQLDPNALAGIPDAPGVYTFFGQDGAPLYIGKSKTLRSRIMSHFGSTHTNGTDMRLFRETTHIEYTETVSDLGASLLELYKIKTESPLLNRLSRRTQGLWLLKKKTGSSYTAFELEKKTEIEPTDFPSLYALFRTKRQAKSMLESLCAEHDLCPKLMGLEKQGGECFSHQLEKCSGACIGKPKVKTYNARIEKVFAGRKIVSWPGQKPRTLRFYDEKAGRAEVFVIDQWILKKASIFEEEDESNLFPLDSANTFFDYDIYKVLTRHLMQLSARPIFERGA